MRKGTRLFQTEFYVDGKEFEFTAKEKSPPIIPAEYETKAWEIVFVRWTDGRPSMDMLGDLDNKQVFEAFSGIKKSLQMWVKDMEKHDEPLNFYFSSKIKEASRAKLYDRFAKQISKKLKNVTGPTISSDKGKKVYIWKEKN